MKDILQIGSEFCTKSIAWSSRAGETLMHAYVDPVNDELTYGETQSTPLPAPPSLLGQR